MTTPAWREFEKLVTRIEHALAGEVVTVKSPDFVPCLTTGTPREVDASLRTRVGSAEILVTVECRDRVAVQDVTWIEQLASKKVNIGAARTIAVAATGFSSEARSIARQHGIDLRVLDEITEDDIKSWMPLIGLIHFFKDCELTRHPEIAFIAEPGDEPEELTIPNLISTPLIRGPNDEMLSLNDIWLRADEQMALFDRIPRDDKDYFVNLTITTSDALQLCTPTRNFQVKSVTLPLRLRWKREDISLSDARFARYRPVDAADSLPEQIVVEFETKEARSNNIRISFQLQKDGERISVSAELVQTELPAANCPDADVTSEQQ